MEALKARFAGLAAPARVREALRGGGEPGVVAALLLALLLGGFALAVDFPKAAYGFQSDEASYYTLGHSLARDGDFAFDRGDLARVYQEFPTGPEGIFLKKGRTRWIERRERLPVDRPRRRARHARRSPLLREVVRLSAGGGALRLAVRDRRLPRAPRGAAVAEPARGLLVPARPQRAGGGAGLCRGVLRRVRRAGLLRVDHARDLQPVDGRARPVLRPVPDGQPRGAGRRRLVEPLPARRRRAVSRRGDHRRRRLLEADQRRAGGADRGRRAAAPRLADTARGRRSARVRPGVRRAVRR